MAGARKKDTRTKTYFNRNLGTLMDMVSEKTGNLAHHDLTDHLIKKTGIGFKSGSVAMWRESVSREASSPDLSLLPSILLFINDRLRPTPPLKIDDLFCPDVTNVLGRSSDELFSSTDLRVSVADRARFGLEHRAIYDLALKPILEGRVADPATPPVSAEAFRRLLDEHVVRFVFDSPNFAASPGNTCASTAELEGNLNNLLSRRGIEVRIAPVIGSLRTIVPGLRPDDLQQLRITMLASFTHKFLFHLLRLREAAQRRAYLAILGNVHTRLLAQDLTDETIRLIAGVCPLSLMPTEQLGEVRLPAGASQPSSPAGDRGRDPLDLHYDVIDSLHHRVNKLIYDLKIRAERAGHSDFVGRQMTWYSPRDFDRTRLYPQTRLSEYLEERRNEVLKRFPFDPYAAARDIEKIDEVRHYFEALEDVSIAIMSLGELKPRRDPLEPFEIEGVAGNIFHQYVDCEGRPIPSDKNSVAFGAPLAWLRDRNREGRLNTVVMATGAIKLHILLAAIRGEYVKTLLTDEDLGSRLYQELLREAKVKHRSPKRAPHAEAATRQG